MKFAFPLFALTALFFAGCTTDANRRDLYSPNKASGPYTQSLEDGTWRNNVVQPVGPPVAQQRRN